MKSSLLPFVFWLTFVAGSSAGTHPNDKDVNDRVIELREIIEKGKYEKDATDRDLYQYWSGFRDQEKMFNETFDKWICTENETELRAIHSEMDRLVQKALIAWDLKQAQLKELYSILHHENYTETALANGKNNITDECKALDKYITKANETAQDEKKELDVHVLEVIDYKDKIDNHTCPCVWAPWSAWSVCSKTCEAGSQSRQRSVSTNVRNVPCIGVTSATITCNDVCCPVDCVWGAWEAWPACPSGCPLGGGLQNKTRTRSKTIEALCNGNECQGEDFEKQPCSREEEVVKDNNLVLRERDQCRLQKQQQKLENNQCSMDLDECKTSIRIPYNGIAQNDSVVYTFDTWGPDYLIIFSMKFNAKLGNGNWYNLFQFTTSGQIGWPAKNYGDRIPAVYFANHGAQIRMFVGMTDVKSLDNSKTFKIVHVPIQKWHQVELQQKQMGKNKATFTAKLNGEVIWSQETEKTVFKNVKWYQSCPEKFYHSIGNHAEIKGMTVTANSST